MSFLPQVPPGDLVVTFRARMVMAGGIGLSAQAAQIVMFREMLSLCRGTELFFGVVLAAGLLWTALGGVCAALFGKRLSPRAALVFYFAGCLLLVAQIAMARLGVTAGEPTFVRASLVTVGATGPVAFVSGLAFVLVLQSAGPRRFALFYQAEGWGAVAGGCVLAMVLAGRVDPIAVGPAAGVVTGVAIALAGRDDRRRSLAGAAVSAAVLLGAVGLGLNDRLHGLRWAARLPSYSLEATTESRYGQLAVLRHGDVDQISFYMDGALVETLPPPGERPTDAINAALFALAQHPDPKRVLLVGGGLGALPEQLLAGKIVALDVVEIDPALVGLARRFGGARADDPRMRVHLADGRYFLKRADARYDVILVKVPAPLSALVNRYWTVEFFREVKDRLNEGGVFVTSVMAAANYPGESVGRLSGAILKTLEEVFGEVLVAPGERHTFLAAAEGDVVSLDPAVLGARLAGRGVLPPGMDPEFRDAPDAYCSALMENLIITSQVARLRETLGGAPASINTDARPIAYQYALLVWNQITSARIDAREPGIDTGANRLFEIAGRVHWRHVLWFPIALAAAGLLLAVAGRPRPGAGAAPVSASYALLLAAFATGLFGMACEVVLLLSFQNAYGYAYTQVSVIVASFMAGLALGAFVGARLPQRPATLAALMALMIVVCASLPALSSRAAQTLSLGALHVMFLGLVVVAGFLDGATFPALVTVFEDAGARSPGGWIYAADLAGAAAGAVSTGAFLVPVLGMEVTLRLVAAVLVAALIALRGVRVRPGDAQS